GPLGTLPRPVRAPGITLAFPAPASANGRVRAGVGVRLTGGRSAPGDDPSSSLPACREEGEDVRAPVERRVDLTLADLGLCGASALIARCHGGCDPADNSDPRAHGVGMARS